jgi:hypothetical protein
MSTYFDAVLDTTCKPIFNGTPKETVQWLRDNPSRQVKRLVCIGKTMSVVTADEYLQLTKV